MKIRWTAQGKLDILKRIDAEGLSKGFVRDILEISEEEVAEWRRNYAAHGITGLKTTKRRPRRGMNQC